MHLRYLPLPLRLELPPERESGDALVPHDVTRLLRPARVHLPRQRTLERPAARRAAWMGRVRREDAS